MKRVFIACLAAHLLFGQGDILSAKRRPLPRPILVKIEHQATGQSLRADPNTGEPVAYNVEGEINYDRRSGNFLLTWMGIRDKRLRVVYEPRLKVDSIVSAVVARGSPGYVYKYSYSVRSLASSEEKLQSFYVETGAPVEQVRSPDSSWIAFSLTDHQKENLQIGGGRQWSQTIQGRAGLLPGASASGFSYASAAQPGIVQCYVAGRTALQDVGEEIPEQLLVAIGKADWIIPQGYTLGPDERLGKMSHEERLNYLVERLPKMLELGWIENQQVTQWYAANLKAGKTAEVRARAGADFRRNLVTSEVLALMTYLTH